MRISSIGHQSSEEKSPKSFIATKSVKEIVVVEKKQDEQEVAIEK